jgi:drug/metabolite transporter (DMT)-like permease
LVDAPVPPVTTKDKGLMLAALGVVMFAFTLPMTRLATAREGYAGLDPVFITAGRAVVAGGLSILYLMATRTRWPTLREVLLLTAAGAGVVIGFPLFLALGVREVDAVHASVITGALPLGTAAFSVLWLRERAPLRFWALAMAGFALVVLYAVLNGGGRLVMGDALLALAVLSASIGYVLGARASASFAPEAVICWILVLYLPLNIPVAVWRYPQGAVSAPAWGAFAYMAVFSMWLGFFAWYRGMALGGALRVSQVQLVQPFLSMIIAVPLLGESITPMALMFCLAIIATVALSRGVR